MLYLQWSDSSGEWLACSQDGETLWGLYSIGQKYQPTIEENWVSAPDCQILSTCQQQLRGYFAGEREQFSLQLAERGTDFQRQVWRLLSDLNYGSTNSYSALAMKLNKPTATRAVASAVGRNPWTIIVPCHRVVGKNGSLTGFAGGLPLKQKLLNLEGKDKI
mgnify:CR=1 FL=1